MLFFEHGAKNTRIGCGRSFGDPLVSTLSISCKEEIQSVNPNTLPGQRMTGVSDRVRVVFSNDPQKAESWGAMDFVHDIMRHTHRERGDDYRPPR